MAKAKPTKRSPNWGGAREKSGRKAVLKDPSQVQFLLEGQHLKILDAYAEAVEAGNRSEAFRAMLEQVNEDYDLGVEA